MPKTIVVPWREFWSSTPSNNTKKELVAGRVISSAITAAALSAYPISAHAAWNDIWNKAESFGDYLCIGTLMFTGGMWMFGHRSKAIEMIIGICCGYEIIIHARDIQTWLKGL